MKFFLDKFNVFLNIWANFVSPCHMWMYPKDNFEKLDFDEEINTPSRLSTGDSVVPGRGEFVGCKPEIEKITVTVISLQTLHQHLNIHFLSQLKKHMDGCFPTAQGSQSTFSGSCIFIGILERYSFCWRNFFWLHALADAPPPNGKGCFNMTPSNPIDYPIKIAVRSCVAFLLI